MPIQWKGTLDDLLPADHLARFIWNVLVALDFTELEGAYRSVDGGPGRPPYHPRILAALWIYGMARGLETAADISEACHQRDDFRWLTGRHFPSDQTLLNFLALAESRFTPIWNGILHAMQERGYVDLSLIIEDGTKLRVNASRKSFHSADGIKKVVEQLKTSLVSMKEEVAPPEKGAPDRRTIVKVTMLQLRLQRAEKAEEELRARAARRDDRSDPDPQNLPVEDNNQGQCLPVVPLRKPKFGRPDFRMEGSGLICPAGQELRFVGQYASDNGRAAYQLFAKSDCSDCPLKEQCTDGRGRRVKISTAEPEAAATPPLVLVTAEAPAAATAASKEKKRKAEPQASLTEPEAVLMLATSHKRWEPSYNADLAVTRDGIIVSQFLTKDPTDFAHFARALPAVISTLGRPDSWAGDGHYGTQANLQIADRANVVLYAPAATNSPTPTKSAGDVTPTPRESDPISREQPKERLLSADDFHLDSTKNVLICPAKQELRFLGRYPTDNGAGTYRLYGRIDCSECASKAQCTEGKGRRVKITETGRRRASRTEQDEAEASALALLIQARDKRMEEVGKAMMKLRGSTVEPVNAHIRQHGLGRLHVHGLSRCQNALTLGCMAHNLLKWRAKEGARAAPTAA